MIEKLSRLLDCWTVGRHFCVFDFSNSDYFGFFVIRGSSGDFVKKPSLTEKAKAESETFGNGG